MRWRRFAGACALAIVPLGLLLLLVPASRPAAEVQSAPRSTTTSTFTSTSTTSTTIELVAEPATTTTTTTSPVVGASPVATSPQTLMLIGDSMAFTAGLGLAPHAAAHGFVLANEVGSPGTELEFAL